MNASLLLRRGILVRFSSGFYVAPDVKLRPEVRKFPLSGIKVALLNRPSIGDFTAKLLEDFGAEVSKFCEPMGGFETTAAHGRLINLNHPEDVNLVKNVARKVDVFIDCLNGGRLEEVGLDPGAMLTANSQLIVARITGYGQTGVYGSRTGADTTFAAMSGAMNGCEGDNTEQSLKIAAKEAKALTMAGRSNCVTGVILALYDREHTGKGQVVDMSVTESIAYIDRMATMMALQIPQPFHRFYLTADKMLLAVGILNPEDQKKFLKLIGANSAGNLEKNIAEKICGKKVADWVEILKDIGSVSQVFDYSNVGNHPQHKDRHSFEFDNSSKQWMAKSVPEFVP
uniref:Uncharacterized protein n=1 Tax=Panagrolaimus sp. JU765 TaxID=591449 RepID=A0AC34QU60_9BILA